MKHRLLLYILSLVGTVGAQAQADHELWSRLTLNKVITHRLTASVDLQHRRHDDATHRGNFFHNEMLNSARLWLFYAPDEQWRIIVSPIAFFEIENSDKQSAITHLQELRAMIGVSRQHKVPGFTINSRLLYEISAMHFNTDKGFTRHRYRLQGTLAYPAIHNDKRFSIHYLLMDEVLVATAKNNTHFDQNRLFNGIKLRWQKTDLQLGCQQTLQGAHGRFSIRHQLVMNLGVQL